MKVKDVIALTGLPDPAGRVARFVFLISFIGIFWLFGKFDLKYKYRVSKKNVTLFIYFFRIRLRSNPKTSLESWYFQG